MHGWLMFHYYKEMIMKRRNEEILKKRMRMIYSDDLMETFTVPPVMRKHTRDSDTHSAHI